MPSTLIDHAPESPLKRLLLVVAPLSFLLPAPLIASLLLPEETRQLLPEWVFPVSLAVFVVLLLLSPAIIAFCVLIAIESWGEWKEQGQNGFPMVAVLWLGSAFFYVGLIIRTIHWVKNLH